MRYTVELVNPSEQSSLRVGYLVAPRRFLLLLSLALPCCRESLAARPIRRHRPTPRARQCIFRSLPTRFSVSISVFKATASLLLHSLKEREVTSSSLVEILCHPMHRTSSRGISSRGCFSHPSLLLIFSSGLVKYAVLSKRGQNNAEARASDDAGCYPIRITYLHFCKATDPGTLWRTRPKPA
jgi:hypothetical protein